MKPMQARYNLFPATTPAKATTTRSSIGSTDAGFWSSTPPMPPRCGICSTRIAPLAAWTLENRHGRAALIAIRGSALGRDPAAATPTSTAARCAIISASKGASMAFLRSSRARATRVKTVSSSSSRASVRPSSGRRFCATTKQTASNRAGSARATCSRLEAGMPLDGHELTEAISPVQAGLNWASYLNKPHLERKGRASGSARARRVRAHRRVDHGRPRAGARRLSGLALALHGRRDSQRVARALSRK